MYGLFFKGYCFAFFLKLIEILQWFWGGLMLIDYFQMYFFIWGLMSFLFFPFFFSVSFVSVFKFQLLYVPELTGNMWFVVSLFEVSCQSHTRAEL